MGAIGWRIAGGGVLCFLAGGVAEAGEAAGGSPVHVDYWQAAYTVVVFLLLVGVLARFAFRPILEALKKREDFIHRSLEEARRNRQEAEAKLQEYEGKLRQVRQEATAIVEEAHRDAQGVQRRLEEEARHSCDAMVDRAKREIAGARDAALKTLFDESAELASSLAAAALKRAMTPEEHQRLVLDSLRELQQRPQGSN